MEQKIDDRWHEEAAYAYFVCSIPGMGLKTVEKLYDLYGTKGGYKNLYLQLKEILEKEQQVCKEMLGLDRRQMASLETCFVEKDIKKEYGKLLYNRIWCIPKYLYGYPDKLKNIYNPPNALYVKGSLPSAGMPVVGVVGARNCSSYGEMIAKEIGKALAGAGIQVVSGMARGVDGISQRSALDSGGNAFGVLGCGVDICYPAENADIYQKMISGKQGGIISEYVPGTEPAPGLFPMRNRIISGLSDVLVVIEAREKSGTYITVTNALEQGKDVYVVPGRIGDALSFGCNRLIAQGANVIYDIKEFVSDMVCKSGVDNCKEKEKEGENINPIIKELSEEERMIYEGVDVQYLSAEEVLTKTAPQLSISEGLILLSTLECKGLIESEGSFYRKKG